MVCKKLSRALYCLNRIKNVLNPRALRTLYFSLFHSHLLYCSFIFSTTSLSNIKHLSILQKKAIRLITHSTYNAHSAPLFLSQTILPVDKIVLLKNACFMHSIYFGLNHPSFNNTWILNIQRDIDHSLRNQNEFHLQLPRTDQFKRSPLYSLPKLWNELPGELRCHENPYTFKMATTSYLYRLIEAECPLPS